MKGQLCQWKEKVSEREAHPVRKVIFLYIETEITFHM